MQEAIIIGLMIACCCLRECWQISVGLGCLWDCPIMQHNCSNILSNDLHNTTETRGSQLRLLLNQQSGLSQGTACKCLGTHPAQTFRHACMVRAVGLSAMGSGEAQISPSLSTRVIFKQCMCQDHHTSPMLNAVTYSHTVYLACITVLVTLDNPLLLCG